MYVAQQSGDHSCKEQQMCHTLETIHISSMEPQATEFQLPSVAMTADWLAASAVSWLVRVGNGLL